MNKLLSAVAVSATLSAVVFSTGLAAADTFYSNIGGGNIFQSKNVTKNGQYNDPTNATCNDTVRFRLYLHNAGPETADTVNVKVALPAGPATTFAATATATPNNADPKYPSVSDTATVKTDKTTKMNYVAGSAEYFDRNGARLGSLSDSIVTTGASLPGGLGVSLNNAKYVAVNAKLTCDTTPVPPTPTPEKPAELTKTGAGDIVALFAVVAAAGAVAYNWVLRRQTR